MKRWVPFAYGFRPFFLLAGVYAVVAILLWVSSWPSSDRAFFGQPAMYWHGHEMIFGFIGAAIAGFMLTAVPSWTGQKGFGGWPLVVLTVAWLIGRLAFFMGDVLPLALVALFELAFLPGLAILIGPSLARTANRNRPLLLVLLAFWLLDAVFLYGTWMSQPMLCAMALRGALGLVMVLITVIGGRIVPAFTGNALRGSGIETTMRSPAVLARCTIAATVAWAIAVAISPVAMITAVIAALAAGLHGVRMLGWQGVKTLRMPIVWVLHLAYAWIPIGLLLHAVSIASGVAWAGQWLHALGAGAAGMMILAVMTRAALGHTGRPLKVGKRIVVAYIALTLAVAVRVFASSTGMLEYSPAIHLAGGLWVFAYGLFVLVYAPVLLLPRVDRKPG
ncbi:NnrS family protein [Marinihelvus fidelis]|nr:NnrS family protein [Marinihelvus fidelis]